MKIATIVGARPQFIKSSIVSRAIQQHPMDIKERIVHTGQHYDSSMSGIFFDQLDIAIPDYNLGVGGGTHGQNTGRMIEKIERVLIGEKPDWVLVYGDTDSTLAGAIAAAKINLPIAHIEAGLRSFNRCMPEEINRVLTDHLASLLFTPTKLATDNLISEGFDIDKICQVGDVMYDAALLYRKSAIRPSGMSDISNFVLCTIHRPENTDDEEKLRNIFLALDRIGQEINIVIPLHPRTLKALDNIDLKFDNIKFFSPTGYLEMLWMLENCLFVITDSGGLQKESYFFKKRCLVVRQETEWMELVESGINIMAGKEENEIIRKANEVLKEELSDTKENLFGNGDASFKVINQIVLK